MQDKKSLFAEVLHFIESKSINYVFLREQSTIEKTISTQDSLEDIDIYIESLKVEEFGKYLISKDFIRLLPNKLFIHAQSGLKIDMHHDTYLRMPFPSEDFFMSNIERVAGWSCLNKQSLFLILLLHPLDMAGFRGHRPYTKEKLHFLNVNKELIAHHDIRNIIESWLGKYFYLKIKELLLKDPKLIIKNYSYLQLASLMQSKELYKFKWKRLREKISSFFARRGQLISIMGIDGSGKTTLSNNLNKFLNLHYNHKLSDVIYMGMLGPYILPINKLSYLYRLVTRKEITQEDEVDFNHIQNMSLLKKTKQKLVIFLIGIDLILRNLIIIWKIYFQKKILITDRSIFDQHTKFNFNIILRTVRLLSLKPSHFIFLKGNTEEIYERKKEYSPAELQKHQDLHLYYLQNNYLKRLIILDATQTKDRVLMQSLKHITQKYNESA